MKKMSDRLRPRGAVQILLKKSGKPVGGIYVDDNREYRSPTLDKKADDAEHSKKD